MIKPVKVTGLAVALVLTGIASQAQQDTHAQTEELPKGWHLLDKAKDGYYGISVDKAYEFIKSKNLKGKTVVVAVIDSGVDTLHEDLKEILWKNPKEIPGNGIDDDGNGYVDDVYGWNFIGNKDGRNLKQDSYEGARVYHKLKAKYDGKKWDPASLKGDDLIEYNTWLKAKARIEGGGDEPQIDLTLLKRLLRGAQKGDSILQVAMGKESFTGNDLDTLSAKTPVDKAAKENLLYLFRANQSMEQSNKELIGGFEEFVSGEERKAEAKDKVPPSYRKDVVGDNEDDINDKYYGNPDVMASTPFHGTHVAGIIGAVRNNGKGMDGVADNVRIMMIRAVPDGDEHDKDIALAIRYAVDNGARVINMSFGKDFSPQKKWIDDAVRYADSKGVLLVHAAGNDSKNVDTADNFPNAAFQDGKGRATNWITVGASGDPKAGGITASFSNYGKKEVDVFAPGVRIYSTIPGTTTYGNAQGTSMASPVVAGAAAFLLEYFPYLTPEQVKFCLEKSARVPEVKVNKPGTDEEVPLTELSRTGGVINVYEAAKIAATLQPVKAAPQKKTPKPTLQNKKG
ncbi:S8 family peptidase [Paraflavitalea sp. CAU 1676]|uniref:S8 family peptidase n=1 Tax=Paraflavitalea sp. CAU 1676 TaxID=3032598 RepID=UPI0023DA4C2B|nr:S8 family peptidase [Paraflavitalea sp. CAU 1676]MDF2192635.1 S8 family peptidase [Paraflavitalea sp. CAU 1676]